MTRRLDSGSGGQFDRDPLRFLARTGGAVVEGVDDDQRCLVRVGEEPALPSASGSSECFVASMAATMFFIEASGLVGFGQAHD